MFTRSRALLGFASAALCFGITADNTADAPAAPPSFSHLPNLFKQRSSNGYHGFTKSRKLKGYMRDHQRHLQPSKQRG
jgi:hypothetical protein